MLKYIIVSIIFLFLAENLVGQSEKISTVWGEVDFKNTLQDWDGFGVNYVEVAQSSNYDEWPQEYGGFSLLSEEKRQEIMNLIFGEEGLKPGIIKMFLDPLHQKSPTSEFDHETTTKWTRYFAQEALKLNEKRGADLEIITTLYGPPAWAKKSKSLGGRDLDPQQYNKLANYMVDWVKYLRETENLPVKYISIHNEGNAPIRWPISEDTHDTFETMDYNAFWRSHEVTHFLEIMRPMLDNQGLEDVEITPGEPLNWARINLSMYDWAIYDHPTAITNIGLLTSHGFGKDPSFFNSDALELLQNKRPKLKAWTTSMSWGGMDVNALEIVRLNIYKAKVNAIIPWAAIQTSDWAGGDPNPGCAIKIENDGSYKIKKGYHIFKHVFRAGQPGMAVANVLVNADTDIRMMGFAANGSKNNDAFVVLNLGWGDHIIQKVAIKVVDSKNKKFRAFRSTKTEDRFKEIGVFEVKDGIIEFEIPGKSIISFHGE